MGRLAGLHHAGPGPLLGVKAALDGQALGQGGSRFGQRVEGEGAAVGASGLVLLHGSGADQSFEPFGGGEAVAREVGLDQVAVRSAAIQPHFLEAGMDALGHVETFVAGAAQLAPMAGAGIDLGMVALTLSKLLASFPGPLSNPAVLCALFGIAPFNSGLMRRRSARVNIWGPAAHGLPLGGCAAGEPVLPDARAASSPDRASVDGMRCGQPAGRRAV